MLPILLLASAALFGTLVQRIVGGGPIEFRALGVVMMLFVAPIPLSLDTYFAGRARGLVFSITQYGLVVVVILLAIYVVIARRQLLASRAGALMAGTTAAALVATHIGMATVAFAVAGAMTALAVGRVVRSRGLRIAPLLDAIRPWSRTTLAAVLSIASILIWGLLTGHGVGALDPMVGIGPFDPVWGEAVFLTVLGGGVLLAAPVALPWIRRTRPLVAFLALSALLAVTAGALGWGIRVPDLNSFHLFFGAIATMLTPISVIAILILLERLRRRGRTRLGIVVLALVISQVLVSATLVVVQLQRFGPGRYPPIALETLATFKTLPDGSKMAYSCEPFENVAPWDASLIALDAHTGVRMIPMCFFADVQRDLLERPLDERIISPYFLHAPQRALYPDADARPSPFAIAAFLNANGIDYIYADATHPNSLIPDALPVFTLDGVTVSRVPPR